MLFNSVAMPIASVLLCVNFALFTGALDGVHGTTKLPDTPDSYYAIAVNHQKARISMKLSSVTTQSLDTHHRIKNMSVHVAKCKDACLRTLSNVQMFLANESLALFIYKCAVTTKHVDIDKGRADIEQLLIVLKEDTQLDGWLKEIRTSTQDQDLKLADMQQQIEKVAEMQEQASSTLKAKLARTSVY